MQLTQFSDYSLRVLLYLTSQRERWVPVPEISRAYGVSQNHLAKVVQGLLDQGYVESLRGRAGGLKLALSERRLRFLEDGMARKFVEEAAHCAFGGPRLAAPGRQTRFQMLAAGSPQAVAPPRCNNKTPLGRRRT